MAGLGLEIGQDTAVLLHDRGALLGISDAAFTFEQLAIAVLQIEFRSPSEALGIGHGDCVSVVDLGKQERVGRIDYQAAEHARHGVRGKHRTCPRTAACNDEIGSTRIEKDAGEQAHHGICQLRFVVGGIHAVIVHLVPEWLDDRHKCVMDDAILRGLAVLIDKGNFHWCSLSCPARPEGSLLGHLGNRCHKEVQAIFDAQVQSVSGSWWDDRRPLYQGRGKQPGRIGFRIVWRDQFLGCSACHVDNRPADRGQ